MKMRLPLLVLIEIAVGQEQHAATEQPAPERLQNTVGEQPERLQLPAAKKRRPAVKKAVPPEKGPAQMQAMITNAMRANLTGLGYSREDIESLVPERARVIVDHGIRRPSSLPPEWTRSGQSGGSGGVAVQSQLRSAAATAALSLVMLAVACALEPALECGRKWAQVLLWFRGGRKWARFQRFFQRVVQPAVVAQLRHTAEGVPELPDLGEE